MRNYFKIISVFVGMFSMITTGLAEETTGEKIENKMDEVKKDTKINARKAKKKIRNAACTDEMRAEGKCGVAEDVKDSARNVKDEVDHNAKKIKNKVD